MSFYTCSEHEHDETMTIFVKMTGVDKHERISVRSDTIIAEALARMMGTTSGFIQERFNVEHKDKLLNMSLTVEESGL